MDLLIKILLWFGVYASPDALDNPDFKNAYREKIDRSQQVIENGWYNYNADGGVVIDEGIGG